MGESRTPQDARSRLKAAAIASFVEDGLQATTSSITRRAGLSTGLLFHYFSTKNDLILDLYGEAIAALYAPARRLPEFRDADKEEFERLLEAMSYDTWRWCLDNWTTYLFIRLVNASATADQLIPGVDVHVQEVRAGVAEVLSRGQQCGALRPVPLDLLTSISQSMTDVVIEYLHDSPERFDDRDSRRMLWAAFWRAIT